MYDILFIVEAITLSIADIAAVVLLFATGPIVGSQQALAYGWHGGWGWHHGWGWHRGSDEDEDGNLFSLSAARYSVPMIFAHGFRRLDTDFAVYKH
jgi:hypothetical protein